MVLYRVEKLRKRTMGRQLKDTKMHTELGLYIIFDVVMFDCKVPFCKVPVYMYV